MWCACTVVPSTYGRGVALMRRSDTHGGHTERWMGWLTWLVAGKLGPAGVLRRCFEISLREETSPTISIFWFSRTSSTFQSPGVYPVRCT